MVSHGFTEASATVNREVIVADVHWVFIVSRTRAGCVTVTVSTLRPHSSVETRRATLSGRPTRASTGVLRLYRLSGAFSQSLAAAVPITTFVHILASAYDYLMADLGL